MNLETFLRGKMDEDLDEDWTNVLYRENTNEDAINGEVWLANRTSYIYRVGVLAFIDANKCDWVTVLIGHEREPGRFEFIGKLHWQDGENDDIGRSLERYLDVMKWMHPVFDGS